MADVRPATQGELRVRIDFNPSEDEMVERVKRAAADFIDLCEVLKDYKNISIEPHPELQRLGSLAQTAAEEACMWAVKAATY